MPPCQLLWASKRVWEAVCQAAFWRRRRIIRPSLLLQSSFQQSSLLLHSTWRWMRSWWRWWIALLPGKSLGGAAAWHRRRRRLQQRRERLVLLSAAERPPVEAAAGSGGCCCTAVPVSTVCFTVAALLHTHRLCCMECCKPGPGKQDNVKWTTSQLSEISCCDTSLGCQLLSSAVIWKADSRRHSGSEGIIGQRIFTGSEKLVLQVQVQLVLQGWIGKCEMQQSGLCMTCRTSCDQFSCFPPAMLCCHHVLSWQQTLLISAHPAHAADICSCCFLNFDNLSWCMHLHWKPFMHAGIEFDNLVSAVTQCKNNVSFMPPTLNIRFPVSCFHNSLCLNISMLLSYHPYQPYHPYHPYQPYQLPTIPTCTVHSSSQQHPCSSQSVTRYSRNCFSAGKSCSGQVRAKSMWRVQSCNFHFSTSDETKGLGLGNFC